MAIRAGPGGNEHSWVGIDERHVLVYFTSFSLWNDKWLEYLEIKVSID